jgi:hypothetical protein
LKFWSSTQRESSVCRIPQHTLEWLPHPHKLEHHSPHHHHLDRGFPAHKDRIAEIVSNGRKNDSNKGKMRGNVTNKCGRRRSRSEDSESWKNNRNGGIENVENARTRKIFSTVDNRSRKTFHKRPPRRRHLY